MLDFERDLVLEVFRMVEGVLVEDEHIGKSSKSEVNDSTKEPGHVLVSLRLQGLCIVQVTYQVIKKRLNA